MFNIAIDESGETCNSHELVKNKSASEIGNAKKRKYFCVSCKDERHPVSLNIRHEVQISNKKARIYTSPAWFSHNGKGGNCGHSKRDNPCSETARHWRAKHILSKHVGSYYFETSKCSGCQRHTHIENGAGARGVVEHSEKKPDGTQYRFDAVLLRGDSANSVVSSVMEVWATHETCEIKREYCLQKGYTFSEFNAQHVLDMHEASMEGVCYKIENLKIRYFECQDCINDKEFYNETCAGAEASIIQLQESLYVNYLDKICVRRKLCIEKEKAIKSAKERADKIKSGIIRNNWTKYEKDVSFKCVCGKWVREDTSLPVCMRIYYCESNEESLDYLVEHKHARVYRPPSPSDNYIKTCGLCSIKCFLCEKNMLLSTSITLGCCHECDDVFFTDDDVIVRSLENKISRIYYGDMFRGFFDYAIEHRYKILAERAVRKLEYEKKLAYEKKLDDEKNRKQTAYANMQIKFEVEYKEKQKLYNQEQKFDFHKSNFSNSQEDKLAHATEFLREIHTLAKQERFISYLYQKSIQECPGFIFEGKPRKGPSWPESTFPIEYNMPNPDFWRESSRNIL